MLLSFEDKFSPAVTPWGRRREHRIRAVVERHTRMLLVRHDTRDALRRLERRLSRLRSAETNPYAELRWLLATRIYESLKTRREAELRIRTGGAAFRSTK